MAQKDDDMSIPGPAWLQTIVKLGLPGAIAAFLVWRMAGGFDVFASRIENLENTTQTQHQAIELHSARIEEMTGQMLLVLRASCVNAAKSDTAREACVRSK